MADLEHLELLRRGVGDWNRWREAHPGTRPALAGLDLSFADLSNANLRGTKFFGANLEYADLRGANLNNSDLRRTNLRRANLVGVNLIGAQLTEAELSSANLCVAELSNSDLRGTNLRDARLRNANLRDATFGGTILGNTELSGGAGLDNCKHSAASTLDHWTIVRSGSLPLSFLRGCGLPDTLIDYLPSILNQPIQFYSCFISFSTKDQEFADRLYADLQNKGVRCWFAPHNMQGGKKIHEQIDQAIRLYDRLLLILSPASIDSEWVKTEIAKARKRERQEERRMLFPVRLIDFETLRDWECFDTDAGKDSAREIREYYVPDFSTWKDHDVYQREFEKLLRDLKAKP